MVMRYPWCILVLVLLAAVLIPSLVSASAPGEMIRNQFFGLPDVPEWGYGLDYSEDGNITLCGVAYLPESIQQESLGNGDAWLIRLDRNGTLLWERIYGGSETDYGLSCRNLPDGGAAVLGTTGSFDGDVTGYHGSGDMWFFVVGPDGNIRWDRALGGDRTDEGGDFVVLPDGGYILCGYTMSHTGDVPRHFGEGDLWLIRLTADGRMVWSQTYGGSRRDSGTSVIMTRNQTIVACGNTNSSDGMVSGNRTSSDVWVIKTDLNGTLLWEKAYGGSGLDWGHSVVELTSGDLMVAAVTNSGDGDVGMNHGAADVWLMRLKPDGTMVWSRTYGGSFSDNVWKLEPSPTDGAYFIGDSYSVDGVFTGNRGEADLLVGEVDKDGTLLWHRQMGGSSVDRGSWIKRTLENTLLLAGMTASSDGDVSGNHTSGDLWFLELAGSVAHVPAPPETPVPVLPDATVQSDTQPVMGPLNGTGPVPADITGDGRYEDLNGNGKLDAQDVTLFFQHFSWLQEQGYNDAFDFNENGALDLGDIQALFEKVKS